MSLPPQKSVAVVHTRVWNMDGLMTAPGPVVKRRSSRRRKCVDCKAGESVLSGSCVLHTPVYVENSQEKRGVRWRDARIFGQENPQTPPLTDSEASSPSECSSTCEEMISTTKFLFSNLRTTVSEQDSIIGTFTGRLDHARNPSFVSSEGDFSNAETRDGEREIEYTEEDYRGFESWVMGSFEEMFCFAKGDCSGIEAPQDGE